MYDKREAGINSSKYLLILIIAFLGACFFNSDTPVTDKLTKDNLTGEWKLTKESINFLRKENICCADKEVKLTLSENNTFELKNMPDCWTNDFGECKGATFSYRGNWSIYQERENSPNHLKLNDREGIYSKVYSVPLIKRKGEIQIVFGFGDPDRNREIYFMKEK